MTCSVTINALSVKSYYISAQVPSTELSRKSKYSPLNATVTHVKNIHDNMLDRGHQT